MHLDIERLPMRMAAGGDWINYRNEIVALHAQADTQADYVTLLECYHALIAQGPMSFGAETWENYEPVARSEYMHFLSHEAMEDGATLSPVMIDYISARELKAGRLRPFDNFPAVIASGAVTVGAPARVRRPGDVLFYVAALASLVIWLFASPSQALFPLALVPFVLIVGWFLNVRERKAAQRRQVERRISRGYPASLR